MSKLFYDHLIDFSELEKLVKKHVKDEEARHEIYYLIDEIIHHKVIGCILDKLPHDHHEEFLDHVHKRAHDESILDYIKERVSEDAEEFIRHEVHALGTELLSMFEDNSKVHKA
jgi:hypothetical protein